MNKNKNLILSIIAVALIVILVVGGTYAYWQWQTTNVQQTNINVSIPGQGDITMTIDGGGNITTKTLAPAQCTNTTYAIQRKVKVTANNGTSTAMTGTVGLTVAALTASQGTLDSTNKASIKYALVEVTEAQYTAAAFTKSGDTCATGAKAAGNFGSLSTNSPITLVNDLSIGANGTTNKWYEFYLWIDKNYGDGSYGATGTTISDPLQDLTINLTWTGSMTNET